MGRMLKTNRLKYTNTEMEAAVNMLTMTDQSLAARIMDDRDRMIKGKGRHIKDKGDQRCKE